MLPEIMQEQIPKLKPIMKLEGGARSPEAQGFSRRSTSYAGLFFAQGLRFAQVELTPDTLRLNLLPEFVDLAQGFRLLPGRTFIHQPLDTTTSSAAPNAPSGANNPKAMTVTAILFWIALLVVVGYGVLLAALVKLREAVCPPNGIQRRPKRPRRRC